MKDHIVICANALPFWTLGLDFASFSDCERAVRWQQIGQGQFDKWEIKTREEIKKMIDAGEITQGCFTDEAWEEFLKNI